MKQANCPSYFKGKKEKKNPNQTAKIFNILSYYRRNVNQNDKKPNLI